MMAEHRDGARWPRIVRHTDQAGRTLPGQIIAPPPLTADAAAAERRTRQRVAREHAASVVAERRVARAIAPARASSEPSKPRPREHRSSTRASRAGPSGDDDAGPSPPRPRCSFCGFSVVEVCWSDQLGEWACWRCYQRQAPATELGPPLALQAESKRGARDHGRASSRWLARAYAMATVAGLRPSIDPVLEVLRCECPGCRAGEGDPLGLWRPMVIVPRRGSTTLRCGACGREEVRHGR